MTEYDLIINEKFTLRLKIMKYNVIINICRKQEVIKCQDLKDAEKSVVNRNIHVLNRKELQIRKAWFFPLTNMK